MVPVFWTGLAFWLLFALAPLKRFLGEPASWGKVPACVARPGPPTCPALIPLNSLLSEPFSHLPPEALHSTPCKHATVCKSHVPNQSAE